MTTVRQHPPPNSLNQHDETRFDLSHLASAFRRKENRQRVSPRNASISSRPESSRPTSPEIFSQQIEPVALEPASTRQARSRRVTSDVRVSTETSRSSHRTTLDQDDYVRKRSDTAVSSVTSARSVATTIIEEPKMSHAAKLRAAAGREKFANIEASAAKKDQTAFKLANIDSKPTETKPAPVPARSRIGDKPHGSLTESVKKFGLAFPGLRKHSIQKPESTIPSEALSEKPTKSVKSVPPVKSAQPPGTAAAATTQPNKIPPLNVTKPPPPPSSPEKNEKTEKKTVSIVTPLAIPTRNGLPASKSLQPPKLSLASSRSSTGSIQPLNLENVSKAPSTSLDDERAEIHRKRAKLAEFQRECSLIAPGLYLGGVDVSTNKDQLKSNGITHILNCAGMVCENLFPNDFVYKTINISDGAQEDLECILYDALRFVISVCGASEGEDASEGAVFVHCQQGVSRSASIVIAYLMLTRNLSYDQSLEIVRQQRPVCKPNIGFMCQLNDWGRRLSSEATTKPLFYKVVTQSALAPDTLVPRRLKVFSKQDLESTTCCLLRTQDRLFRWVGAKASAEVAAIAEQHEADLIKYEHANPCEVIFENSEPSEFFEIIQQAEAANNSFLIARRSSMMKPKIEVNGRAEPPTSTTPSSISAGDDAPPDVVDVFLGGSCNPTTWRKEIAIPKLHAHGASFFNPQVDHWSPAVMAQEVHHKKTARYLLFVIDHQTRAIASMMEVIEYAIKEPKRLVLVVSDVSQGHRFNGADSDSDKTEIKDLNRGRAYVREIATRNGAHVCSDIASALDLILEACGKNAV